MKQKGKLMLKRPVRVDSKLAFGPSSAIVMLAVALLISCSQPASMVANVTFSFDNQTNQTLLKIDSPTGVSAAELRFDIPGNVTVVDTELSGFLTGSTHLSQGREHRWFQLSANNDKEASLATVIEPPQGTTYVITLLGVDLKDSQGNAIPIATSFPIHVTIGPAP
jgi:hypothetical protein